MRNGTMFQLVMPDDVMERVKDYQFANRLNSRSEALRQLIESGLTKSTRKAAKNAA